MSGPYGIKQARELADELPMDYIGTGNRRSGRMAEKEALDTLAEALSAAYAAGRAELEQMRKALLDTTLALDKLPSGRRYAGTLMQAKDALRCIPLEELVALKSRECASELQEHCELVPSDCRCERAIRALLAPQADKDQQT